MQLALYFAYAVVNLCVYTHIPIKRFFSHAASSSVSRVCPHSRHSSVFSVSTAASNAVGSLGQQESHPDRPDVEYRPLAHTHTSPHQHLPPTYQPSHQSHHVSQQPIDNSRTTTSDSVDDDEDLIPLERSPTRSTSSAATAQVPALSNHSPYLSTALSPFSCHAVNLVLEEPITPSFGIDVDRLVSDTAVSVHDCFMDCERQGYYGGEQREQQPGEELRLEVSGHREEGSHKGGCFTAPVRFVLNTYLRLFVCM